MDSKKAKQPANIEIEFNEDFYRLYWVTPNRVVRRHEPSCRSQQLRKKAKDVGAHDKMTLKISSLSSPTARRKIGEPTKHGVRCEVKSILCSCMDPGQLCPRSSPLRTKRSFSNGSDSPPKSPSKIPAFSKRPPSAVSTSQALPRQSSLNSSPSKSSSSTSSEHPLAVKSMSSPGLPRRQLPTPQKTHPQPAPSVQKPSSGSSNNSSSSSHSKGMERSQDKKSERPVKNPLVKSCSSGSAKSLAVSRIPQPKPSLSSDHIKRKAEAPSATSPVETFASHRSNSQSSSRSPSTQRRSERRRRSRDETRGVTGSRLQEDEMALLPGSGLRKHKSIEENSNPFMTKPFSSSSSGQRISAATYRIPSSSSFLSSTLMSHASGSNSGITDEISWDWAQSRLRFNESRTKREMGSDKGLASSSVDKFGAKSSFAGSSSMHFDSKGSTDSFGLKISDNIISITRDDTKEDSGEVDQHTPSAEELQRRLSEERQVALKIKELNALFCESDLLKTDSVEVAVSPVQEAASEVKPSSPVIVPSGSPKKTRSHKKGHTKRSRRTKKGQETSWVYLNAFEDFSDVRTRHRLMKGYNSSSSDEDHQSAARGQIDNRPVYHPHLHALHRFRREKKKGIAGDKEMAISYMTRVRTSLVNRNEFFYRFGAKEKEACAAFNFLDDLSTSTPSSPEKSDSNLVLAKSWSEDQLSIRLADVQLKLEEKERLLDESSEENPPAKQRACRDEEEVRKLEDESEECLVVEVDCDPSTSLYKAVDRISLSDSCAESYYGSDSELSFRSHPDSKYSV